MPDSSAGESERRRPARGRRAGRSSLVLWRGGRAARPGNLPVPISSFVGREREIGEVGRQLGRARLLTLTGAGGVGKSRLALEVASRQVGRFSDGAWLVELAALADSRLLPQAVTSALGLREQPGQAPLDTLIGFLRPRDLLLILDNCEHLVEASAALAGTLLRACPHLRILATSRLPLGAPGEVLWRVPSLALPDSDGHAREIVESEAARLFVDRAREALRTFGLTDAQVPALAEICRRLDGIPLALELAAAMVPVLTVEQIARRLDDRFALLTGGSRAGLPRHRTLRALVDWSYDLATEDERILLRRLAVFAGGWTMEAAEAVCDGGKRDEGRGTCDAVRPSPLVPLRSSLRRLVAASLVMTDGARGEARFHLLETIREYALERLRASGEEAAVRQRHLDWAVALVEDAEPRLWTAEQRACLERLDRELANLRAALAWSLEAGQTEAGLQIAGGPWRYWEQRGHVSEARGWLNALLDRPGGRPGVARARALASAGYFAHVQGDRALAQTLEDEALELARAVDDAYALVVALQVQAILVGTGGDLDRSEAYLQEAYARSREAGLGLGVRISLLNLGELARMRGDDRTAARLLEETLALSEAAGDGYSQAFISMCLGHLRFSQGDPAQAERRFGRALTLFSELDDLYNVAHGLDGLAWTAAAEERAERAARLLGAVAAQREAQGSTILAIWQVAHDRAESAARAALGERAFAAAWRRGRAMPRMQAIEYALSPDAQLDVLTVREREIVRLIAEGRVNREIAETLGLSERTVEWHVSNVLGKLGVRSRAQIVTWALEHGLVGDASAIPDGD